LTRVDEKGLRVKNTLKVTKEDIKAENRRIRKVATQKLVKMQLIFSTLFAYSKVFIRFSELLDNVENVIINILEKDPNEAFQKRMKEMLK